jgi:hypothetical protein
MFNSSYKSFLERAIVLGVAFDLIVPCVQAATFTFPSNGGFLDSEAEWGETMPTTSDNVMLDKPGVYRISSDVAFTNLYVSAGGITNDFGEHEMSFIGKGGVACTGEGFKMFSGGRYSTYNFTSHYLNGTEVLLTNGCEVVCDNMFYSARYVDGTITRITDGSKVYTKDLRIQNDTGRNNELVVSGGEKCMFQMRCTGRQM